MSSLDEPSVVEFFVLVDKICLEGLNGGGVIEDEDEED